MPQPTTTTDDNSAPLQDLDHWEEFLQARYPAPSEDLSLIHI